MRKIVADLTKKTIKDLESEMQSVKTEVQKLKIEYRVKPQKDTNLIKKKRMQIAQIATVLHEKKLFEASKPKVESKKVKN